VQGGDGGQRVQGTAVIGGGVVAAPPEWWWDGVAKMIPPEGAGAHAAVAAVAEAGAAHRQPAAGPGDRGKGGDPALLQCPFYTLALAVCFDDLKLRPSPARVRRLGI
jgi:hypothetical protein